MVSQPVIVTRPTTSSPTCKQGGCKHPRVFTVQVFTNLKLYRARVSEPGKLRKEPYMTHL